MGHRLVSRRSFIGMAGALTIAGLVGCSPSTSSSSASGSASASASAAASAASAGAKDTLTIYVGAEPEDGFDPMTGYGAYGDHTFSIRGCSATTRT